MLSRQRVPWGERVLMLVNWVDGTRGQSFSFLSMSSSELWGGEPKSPSTTNSFSPAKEDYFLSHPGHGLSSSSEDQASQFAFAQHLSVTKTLLPVWALTFECFLDAVGQIVTLDVVWVDGLAIGLHVDVHHCELMRTNLQTQPLEANDHSWLIICQTDQPGNGKNST